MRRAEGAALPPAVLPLLRALGAREELVPRADAGAAALDEDRVLGGVGRETRERVADELGEQRVVDEGTPFGGGCRGVAQCRRQRGQLRAGRAGTRLLGDRAIDEPRADLVHQLDVDSGVDLECGVVPPRGDLVVEPRDVPAPLADLVEQHLRLPPVGAGRHG